jgi:hypothetical protein
MTFHGQVMDDGEEHGVVKVADFGLARIYQAPLKPLSENGVRAHFSSVYLRIFHVHSLHDYAMFNI